MRAPACRTETVGHILIRGASVTRGYFGDPEATAAAIDANGWLDTGDLGVIHEGVALHRRPRQGNHFRQWPELLSLRSGEHRAARARPRTEQGGRRRRRAGPARRARNWWCSCSIAAAWQDFLPTAAAVGRLINEHTGLEVAQVIPTKRIPKTTSGKVQRHLLEKAYIDGEFDARTGRTQGVARSAGRHRSAKRARVWRRGCKRICEAALPGKRIDVE